MPIQLETSPPLIDLVDGRYPAKADEVALTDRAFADVPATGSTIELDGVTVTVVGTVENPMTLTDEFVLGGLVRCLIREPRFSLSSRSSRPMTRHKCGPRPKSSGARRPVLSR